MFRYSTILRELVQSLAKVIFQFKHPVKLRRCILCGDVAAWHGTACVLFVVQTDTESVSVCTTNSRTRYQSAQQTAGLGISLHNKQHACRFMTCCHIST